MTESFVAHDRAGRAKAGVHDNVAPCCVATEEAMCARQTKPSAHDRPWVCPTEVAPATGEFFRDRENYVTTEGRGSKELYVTTGLFLIATER